MKQEHSLRKINHKKTRYKIGYNEAPLVTYISPSSTDLWGLLYGSVENLSWRLVYMNPRKISKYN